MNSFGKFTYPEISSQHEAMAAALKQLQEQSAWISTYLQNPDIDEVIFIGSGSSYYQSQTMAAVYRKWTGKPASALPSSELYLCRDFASAANRKYLLVGVSRSGESSEVILALKSVAGHANWTTCGITCYEDSAMAKLTECLISPLGKESSTVMTRSFSSMTFMMIAAIAHSAGRSDWIEQLEAVPALAESTVKRADAFIQSFIQANSFNKYVYLGMGPYYGLANEANLKVKEMSNVWAESFSTLEFRHGPKSIVNPGTLVCLLLSNDARKHELKVAQEMKAYGATVLIITSWQGEDTSFADAVFEIGGISQPDDSIHCILYLSAVQYLGMYTAIQKGIDPDSPRNLTQVVIIE